MELKKVKRLEDIKLSPNSLLIEFVEKKSSIVLANQTGPSSTLEKELVILSTCEDINPGDIILDARYQTLNGEIAVHAYEDRKFTVVTRHEVKMWTTPDNVKEDK